jgi:hypothetical protein
MLVCTHCGSQSVVHDREYVPGTGYVYRPRCMKCGREKFKEVAKEPVKPADNITGNYTSPMQVGEKIKKEKIMSTPVLKCIVDGCDEPVSASHLCAGHFQGQYGITVAEYRDNRRWKTESPKKVATRMKNEDEADRIKRNQDAKETFDKAMQEEKEKREPEQKTPKPEAKVWPGEDIVAEEKAETSILLILPNSLIQRIEKAAIDEFRPFHMQVAYYLHHGMKAVSK